MSSIRNRVTNWERWPFTVIYAPLGFLWLYYACKARAFWFSSNVNPTLEFSGIEGETKKEMYNQLPKHLYPETLYVDFGINFTKVLDYLSKSTIVYPFVVKPDIGMQGILFRKIECQQELFNYHHHIPADYIIQQLVDLPLEYSVFYIRYPGEAKGKVTGFILKEYPFVVGDGKGTLLELIQKHPNAKYREEEMRNKHQPHLLEVLPVGKKYVLSYAGNHNRGARFINLHQSIDQQLTDVFDNISNEVKDFYYGRYDIKCTSIEDLKQGINFSILEYNGAGAEPNHIYDCGMNYWQALAEIARHWKAMYEIGRINKKRGIPYWSYSKGYRHMKNSAKFFNKLRKYDNIG